MLFPFCFQYRHHLLGAVVCNFLHISGTCLSPSDLWTDGMPRQEWPLALGLTRPRLVVEPAVKFSLDFKFFALPSAQRDGHLVSFLPPKAGVHDFGKARDGAGFE